MQKTTVKIQEEDVDLINELNRAMELKRKEAALAEARVQRLISLLAEKHGFLLGTEEYPISVDGAARTLTGYREQKDG